MKGKRELAAQLAVRAGLVGPIAAVNTALNDSVKVLAYHRVLPRTDEASFAFDLELISAWQEEFDWQVGYLARHHHVVTCRDLAACLDSGSALPRGAVIITFDDGYRDNHDIVLPILRRHGVPAVMFVATGYIGGQSTFWYDELVHALLHTTARHLDLSEGGRRLALGTDAEARRQVARAALSHLKTVSDAQRHADLARWRLALGVPAPQLGDTLHGPMSWAQVKALSGAGIEIGSHSVTHPVLAKIDDDEQLRSELSHSKAAIDAQTGRDTISIAYPVGGPDAYSSRVVDATRRAGYRFAFTYQTGVNDASRWDVYRLRRLAVERYLSRARFRAMLAAPAFFA